MFNINTTTMSEISGLQICNNIDCTINLEQSPCDRYINVRIPKDYLISNKVTVNISDVDE